MNRTIRTSSAPSIAKPNATNELVDKHALSHIWPIADQSTRIARFAKRTHRPARLHLTAMPILPAADKTETSARPAVVDSQLRSAAGQRCLTSSPSTPNNNAPPSSVQRRTDN